MSSSSASLIVGGGLDSSLIWDIGPPNVFPLLTMYDHEPNTNEILFPDIEETVIQRIKLIRICRTHELLIEGMTIVPKLFHRMNEHDQELDDWSFFFTLLTMSKKQYTYEFIKFETALFKARYDQLTFIEKEKFASKHFLPLTPKTLTAIQYSIELGRKLAWLYISRTVWDYKWESRIINGVYDFDKTNDNAVFYRCEIGDLSQKLLEKKHVIIHDGYGYIHKSQLFQCLKHKYYIMLEKRCKHLVNVQNAIDVRTNLKPLNYSQLVNLDWQTPEEKKLLDDKKEQQHELTEEESISDKLSKKNVESSMMVAYNKYNVMIDDRVYDMIMECRELLTYQKLPNELTIVKDMSDIVPFMPLCIKIIYDHLHLTGSMNHSARVQYLLFMKNIGASPQTILRNTESAYKHAGNGEKFDKDVKAKFEYGLFTNNSKYHDFSCTRLIHTVRSTNGCNGCPYSNYYEAEQLDVIIQDQFEGTISSDIIKEIRDIENTPMIKCQAHLSHFTKTKANDFYSPSGFFKLAKKSIEVAYQDVTDEDGNIVHYVNAATQGVPITPPSNKKLKINSTNSNQSSI